MPEETQWWVDELVALEAPEVQLEEVEFRWDFQVRRSSRRALWMALVLEAPWLQQMQVASLLQLVQELEPDPLDQWLALEAQQQDLSSS